MLRRIIAIPFRRGTRLRTALLALGLAGLVAGLALVSLGLYQYLDGTDASSTEAVQATATPTPDATLGATPSPAPATPPPAVAPPLRESNYRVIIDSIGVDAPVYTYGLDANRVPEVPLNPSDVAWYNFSAHPGTGSNAVLAGHVTWNGRAVFYRLDQVKPGDRIVLRGNDGTELVYTVRETFLVDASDPNALSVMGATATDMITLITCGGTFEYTGDPVFNGEYDHRLVVRAELSLANLASGQSGSS